MPPKYFSFTPASTLRISFSHTFAVLMHHTALALFLFTYLDMKVLSGLKIWSSNGDLQAYLTGSFRRGLGVSLGSTLDT